MSQNLKSTEEDYSDAIGRTESKTMLITAEKVEALMSSLDLKKIPGDGKTLPPGWHWMFFNPFIRRSELGVDGHPKRGGFLPDVKLPRRMWAGGRLEYHAPLPLDTLATRNSEIIKVVSKNGRAGKLVFVTVKHTITHGGSVCIVEEQDIVYREAPAADAPTPNYKPASENAEFSDLITPDTTLLFRYSALTSNGHRIHYDQPYAQNQEGYRDLVVHGPLIATILQGLAVVSSKNKKLKTFDFRGMAPLFVDKAFHVEASLAENGEDLSVWARGPDGELAMQANASFKI